MNQPTFEEQDSKKQQKTADKGLPMGHRTSETVKTLRQGAVRRF